MVDVIRILLFVVLAAGVVWVIVREAQREHERQELAKKNMSFIESIIKAMPPKVESTDARLR